MTALRFQTARPRPVEADRDEPWQDRAACRVGAGFDPDLWTGGPAEQATAMHVCRAHCPVLEQCLAEALRDLPSSSVWGGVAWTRTGERAFHQPHAESCLRCGPPPLERGSCGTLSGWSRHKRMGAAPCDRCREARRAYKRAWRRNRVRS